ncbi:MAG: tellurium resistance protein TerC [Myxococcota bacterium]|nr:tellurium resistance protein TerC [Myxococcota bacterium]
MNSPITILEDANALTDERDLRLTDNTRAVPSARVGTVDVTLNDVPSPRLSKSLRAVWSTTKDSTTARMTPQTSRANSGMKAKSEANRGQHMDLLSIDNLITLVILIFLQAVLGFDNLLYLSIESKRVPPEKQAYVRKVGIALAIILRIVLLFALVSAIDSFQTPFAHIKTTVIAATVNVHAVIVLSGGIFIIYTAIKELFHMLRVDNIAAEGDDAPKRTVGQAIFWIVVMNLVFSFDSILSALALTKVFAVMALAIIISGVLMVVMADRVALFLERNRLYEVLGLFVLLLVGILLVSEGGHLAHLEFFGYPIVAMSKSTFYFTLFIMIAVELAQSRYQNKLFMERTQQQVQTPESTIGSESGSSR